LGKVRWGKAVKLTLLCSLAFGLIAPGAAGAAEDHTSKFRVYQNNKALKEFAEQSKAIQYAKSFKHAYVERIDNRSLAWDNMPRYKVYQKDSSRTDWEFLTLEEAVKEAKKWANASVRDLSSGGWVWHNYKSHPGYTLYQGDKMLPNWKFQTLEAAKAEGKKWGNAHIIDGSNNRWVWDNITEAQKVGLRQGEKIYQVFQGEKTKDEWQFAFLQDAVNEAVKWANSSIVNVSKNEVVFRNETHYAVFVNGVKKSSFLSLPPAIYYASKQDHAEIVWDGRTIWSNAPYYQVMRDDIPITDFTSFKDAVAYGAKQQNVEIVTLDDQVLWDNLRKLIYMAWNGEVRTNVILTQTAPTQGLDIDSPTWFTLKDASGAMNDTSDPATVAALKAQGLEVHPLVHNQFNSKLTSAFLADAAAQSKFIGTLVNRLVEIGAQGVNIDFETMSGSDRDKYTAFVTALSAAAHAKGLTVSIDLPRGSMAWNHKTAYDHAKLAEAVDYIAIMAYDQFWSGSDSPGPVSALNWAEEGVQDFLSYGIPRSKLLLGIPFYVRLWELDSAGKLVSNRAVFMKDIPALIESTGYTVTKDAKYGVDRIDFTKEGKRYVFWMEDLSTVKQRIDIAKKYDLAGVAAWRLGYEPAELWTEMLRAK
jgi:spore germination protein YaaH